MTVYIIPIATVLLSFLALIATLRFIFSRLGLYWVFPALISALFFFQNLNILLALGEAGLSSFEYTFSNFNPFTMAVLWYMMIVVFHYALKKNVDDNRFENDSRKNRTEAAYLEKYERRRGRRERKRRKKSTVDSLKIPEIPEYRTPDDID